MKKDALLLILFISGFAACNPFAPGIEEIELNQNQLMGDRRYVDGFFEWFKNSYEFRDSSLYGVLLAPDFTFTYYDFNQNLEVNWGRAEEIATTYNMFVSVKAASLQWNNYFTADTAFSDTSAFVERAFNLTIIQDDQRIYRGVGRARLQLVRAGPGQPWRMRSWFDNSDF